MSDLISRKWLMECVDEGWIKFDTEKDKNIYVHLVRDIAPSAQEAHEERAETHACDLISRQAAIDNLKRHLNETDVPDSYPGIFNAIEEWLSDWEVPSAKPDSKESSLTQKALDSISRQDAIDAVKKHYRIDNDLLELIAYEIEQLPSLQPEVIACGSGELKDESEWVSAGEMDGSLLKLIPIFGEDDHDE